MNIEMTELEKRQAEIIEQQSHEIALLKEQIQVLMKKLFGTSSEKSSKIGAGQLSIFDEASPFFLSQSQLKKKPTKKK